MLAGQSWGHVAGAGRKFIGKLLLLFSFIIIYYVIWSTVLCFHFYNLSMQLQLEFLLLKVSVIKQYLIVLVL